MAGAVVAVVEKNTSSIVDINDNVTGMVNVDIAITDNAVCYRLGYLTLIVRSRINRWSGAAEQGPAL